MKLFSKREILAKKEICLCMYLSIYSDDSVSLCQWNICDKMTKNC